MNTTLVHRPLLSRPAVVTGGSLLAMGLLVLLLWSPWQGRGGPHVRSLRLYCAAALSKPMQEILAEYERAYGVQIEVTYGPSGTLLSSIKTTGGRGDLYLAADANHIREARKAGVVEEVLPLGILKPVLVVNRATHAKLEKQGRPLRSAKDLLRPDLKVVLANAEVASIGQLARDVLQPLGIWKGLEEGMRDRSIRVTTMDTVQQVAQSVQTMEDCAGIVWSAVAAQQPQLVAVSVPEFAGVEEAMQIGVLANSTQPAAALKFARFLSAAGKGQQILREHHYDLLPDADRWEEEPTLHLAAGAMLKPALENAVAKFELREGVKVNTTYAGCGHLVAMMQAIKKGDNSQVFPDIYFACDTAFLEQVQPWFDAGRTLSKNDLVLLVAKGNPHEIQGLADLARPQLRVGLGHPTHTALGKLTEDLLNKLGLYHRVYDPERAMPVQHADAGHMLVSQMVVEALDAAVVYRSNALGHPPNVDKHFDIVELPGGHAARQPFAVAKDSPRRYLARRFLDALTTPSQADRFRALGFGWLQGGK